jgi:hypothetical protein
MRGTRCALLNSSQYIPFNQYYGQKCVACTIAVTKKIENLVWQAAAAPDLINYLHTQIHIFRLDFTEKKCLSTNLHDSRREEEDRMQFYCAIIGRTYYIKKIN